MLRRLCFMLICAFGLARPSQAESCAEFSLEAEKLYLENISGGVPQLPVEFTSSSQCSKVGETRLIMRLPEKFFSPGLGSYQKCVRVGGKLAVIASKSLPEVEDAIWRDQVLTFLRANQPEKQKELSKVRLRTPEPGVPITLPTIEYQAYHLHGNGGPLNDMPELNAWHAAPYFPCKDIGPEPPLWPGLLEWVLSKFRSNAHDSHSNCEVRQRMSLVPGENGCLTTSLIERRQRALLGDGKDQCQRILRQAEACKTPTPDANAPIAVVTLLAYSRAPVGPTCVRFSLPAEMCRPGSLLHIVELFAGTRDGRVKHVLK